MKARTDRVVSKNIKNKIVSIFFFQNVLVYYQANVLNIYFFYLGRGKLILNSSLK